MLNQFRIGTKLIGGFAVVLVLLLVIWQVGRWAINQKTLMAVQVADAEALITAGLTMQRDILDAMNAVNLETLTREKEYADNVQKIASKIQEEHEKDLDLIPKEDEDIRKKYRELLANVARFAQTDASAWNTETKRKEADEKRVALGIATVDETNALSAAIIQASKNGMVLHFNETIQKEESYYPVAYIEREQIAADLIKEVLHIRRMCLFYELASEENVRTETRNGILEIFKKIDKELGDLDKQLELPTTRKILADVMETSSQWRMAVILNMDLLDQYYAFDVQTTKIADDLISGINPLLKEFDRRSQAAAKADVDFNSFIQWTLTVASVIALLLGGVLSYALTQNIKTGIGRAVACMTIIAEKGNVDLEISSEDKNRKDEVGDLIVAVGGVLRQFQNVERLAKELAVGNYTAEIKERGDLDTMNINLNKMLLQVNHALHEINDSVGQVATGSSEVSTAAQNLSSGAQEAAASLEQITASMSEISSQTKANAESASQARDLAHKATNAATEGQQAMQSMTGAMERITSNSNEIQRVIKVIDDIAFQTNLLALNAAVEAARAGQHGKGFAVVAEEVRNLASRSAKAAQETSELIAKSGQEIEKGGEIAGSTAEVLNVIVDQIKQTTDLIGGIAVASNEQAEGVNQVTIGLQQIDAVTQQNTASAEESASAANEMSGMATQLQKLVALFKLK